MRLLAILAILAAISAGIAVTLWFLGLRALSRPYTYDEHQVAEEHQ